jgi:UDP-N-acetylglucosamine--N-acetylmuramyl-(pentapeptide) pyrophosphoryl-undecaprenol N-acetylglucosamine transferase
VSARVVIAGGGTGGHIFPGLAVASELQGLGIDCHWLGAKRGLEAELVGKRGIPTTLVDIEGIRGRSPIAALRAATSLPRAVAATFTSILRLQPSVVLGVGGYASGAGLLAAGLLGVPAVLQEQNSVPGWTNTALAPWADLICCGFEDAISHFPSLPTEWTGNPVREEFFAIPDVEPHDPPHLLVLGGSQGSLFLNRTVPRALALLKENGLEPVIHHQTGARWAEVVGTSYQDLGVAAEVVAFLSEPWQALVAADLVVARSGALTVSELAAAGRGGLLVPFAGAAGNHQEYNARSLERAGGAMVLTEVEASPQRVAKELHDLLTDAERLRKLGRATRTMARRNAAKRIAERLLSVGGSP